MKSSPVIINTKTRKSIFLLSILLILFTVTGGCAKLFGPSDKEAVDAIMATGLSREVLINSA